MELVRLKEGMGRAKEPLHLARAAWGIARKVGLHAGVVCACVCVFVLMR